jgi:hypothetical protein
MKYNILTLLLFFSYGMYAQEKNKILALGTFHFHLAASQFNVDFDIKQKECQEELHHISQQIQEYKPTKIFVEWEYAQQAELDTLYALYLKDTTMGLIQARYGKNETKYAESEVQQLGFRIARGMGLNKLYAFDYALNEPNDTLMKALEKANQTALMSKMQQEFGEYGQSIVNTFQKERSIKKLLLFLNSTALEQRLNSGYISLFNTVGAVDDFSGSYFVAERFRRNLYMYALIQKQVAPHNERILVLVGSQHAAGFRDFIRDDKNVENVPVASVLH